MINEIIDLFDSIPIPSDLLFLMDGFHKCSKPAIGSLDDVIFSVVNLQHVGIMGCTHSIGDGVFINQ